MALLVIVLGLGVTLYALGHRGTAAPAATGTPSVAPDSRDLSPAQLMTPAQAASILPGTRWRTVAEQTGESPNGSRAACLSAQATAQAAQPQLLLSRSLSAQGDNPPVALHQAMEYASTAEATASYAVFARALGNCDLASGYLLAGAVVNGLGDQSTAVVVDDQQAGQLRTLVLDRTGRVINVLDVVTRQGRPGPVAGAVSALGKVTDGQCTDAVGLCASLVSVHDGPPPVAGDQPGYLALADLPRPEVGKGTWAGLAPGRADALVTSGCENVDFGDVDAQRSTARSYLLADKPAGMPASFGLDEAVFTMDGEKAADTLGDKLNTNLEGCPRRVLTARVCDEQHASGTGAGGVGITATTWRVSQQVSDNARSTYRVGVAVAGDRVVYTFLPVAGRYDLTDPQWNTVTVRAAQRATQAN